MNIYIILGVLRYIKVSDCRKPPIKQMHSLSLFDYFVNTSCIPQFLKVLSAANKKLSLMLFIPKAAKNAFVTV